MKAQALQVANQHLIELSKEKDQFIRMAAHDLRNPLSTISMAATVLETQKKEGKNFDKMVNIISNQSKSMLELLNDILNANLIQSGQFVINKQPVDIQKFIEEVCEFHRLIASKKNIEIQLVEKISQPISNIDKIKIRQVIDNFLSNAIKFSPPNTIVKVICTTTPTDLKVEVKDQGPGFPLENKETIFEQSARNSAGEAHGLGLVICKQIIRAYEGEIGISPQEGKGTTFYFDVKT